MSDNQSRADLEIRIAFLEDALDTLERVITRQTRDIEQLERVNQRILKKMADLEEYLETLHPQSGREPPPPHY